MQASHLNTPPATCSSSAELSPAILSMAGPSAAASSFLLAECKWPFRVARREADALYKAAEGWAWKAADHVFAKPGTGTPIRFDNVVPPSLIRKLSFEDPAGHVKPPKFIVKDKVALRLFVQSES
jgi:hypothetical protein